MATAISFNFLRESLKLFKYFMARCFINKRFHFRRLKKTPIITTGKCETLNICTSIHIRGEERDRKCWGPWSDFPHGLPSTSQPNTNTYTVPWDTWGAISHLWSSYRNHSLICSGVNVSHLNSYFLEEMGKS